jgi:hypothetical protein
MILIRTFASEILSRDYEDFVLNLVNFDSKCIPAVFSKFLSENWAHKPMHE